jgi:hypothetical protein
LLLDRAPSLIKIDVCPKHILRFDTDEFLVRVEMLATLGNCPVVQFIGVSVVLLPIALAGPCGIEKVKLSQLTSDFERKCECPSTI